MCDSLNVMQGENLKVQYGYTGTCSTGLHVLPGYLVHNMYYCYKILKLKNAFYMMYSRTQVTLRMYITFLDLLDYLYYQVVPRCVPTMTWTCSLRAPRILNTLSRPYPRPHLRSTFDVVGETCTQ
jgi:hypothetical protein